MPGHGRSLARGLVAIGLLAGSCTGIIAPGGAAGAQTQGPPPPEAFVAVDAGTGVIVTSRNAHEPLPPASIAKIMTALVAAERLPPNALVPVSANAAGREAMKIGMQAGTRWPFEQAMASLMMISANDAAYAVAEAVGGSVDRFAADLNATAKRYGMRDSTFGDPAGLDDGSAYNGGPRVSAYDLAIATRNALTVPTIARFAALRTYQFTDVSGAQHSLTNHNRFLPDNGFGYGGANGFKTGFTNHANHTLVATAERSGRQCIAVILGSSDSGYAWAASLLDQCFASPAAASATATRLPPVAVSPYETRQTEQRGFIALAGGTAALSAASGPTPTTGAATPTSPVSTRTVGGKAGAGSGVLTTTRVVVIILALLVACFLLRRRAVRRRRARRIQRRRARAKAMRSGSLPVVDGRYRTGTRIGPPLESQVRVDRADVIDLTAEDRNPSELA